MRERQIHRVGKMNERQTDTKTQKELRHRQTKADCEHNGNLG